jgi:outer membrane protein OmpA-like peptidoglycan-associated protein
VRTEDSYDAHRSYLSEGQTLTHIEIVKVEDFKATLAVVTAEEMSTQIANTGHVALYGLYFDTDSDQLRSDSQPTLQQIAKALGADASLSLYVVGHTDNQGAFEYNQELSESRATAVVQALAKDHGIVADRLIPLGVGLASPVANNDTEDGRSLNRRVELVKR